MTRTFIRWFSLVSAVVCAMTLASWRAHAQTSTSLGEQLATAASAGDVATVNALIAKGADINWQEPGRGATPVYSAAEHGRLEVVKILLDHGANPNVKDYEWGRTPLKQTTVPSRDPSVRKRLDAIAALLVAKGADPTGETLVPMIRAGQYDLVRTIVSRGKVIPSYLNLALAAAKRTNNADLVDFLTKAGAQEPGPLDQFKSAERLKRLTGIYRSESGEMVTISESPLEQDVLLLEQPGKPRLGLFAVDLMLFRSHDMQTVVALDASTLPPKGLTIRLRNDNKLTAYTRTGDAPASAAATPASRGSTTVSPDPRGTGTTASAAALHEWPSFRGPGGTGVAAGAHPPTAWDGSAGTNIRWKTPIPGLANSSPIVWGDRLFITTAAPKNNEPLAFETGAAADSEAEFGNRSQTDDMPYSWRVYALDKQTGKIVWERVAREGVPRTHRHIMETQNNSTPATDGRHLIAFFGSEGLYCYDVDGKLLWSKDLGPLRAAYVMDPTYEWTTANSPVLYKNMVIIQVDMAKNSFIAAFDITNGKELWRTPREEVSSFSSPIVYEGPVRTEILTVGSNFARGYDPTTGRELWRMGKQTTHATPIPVVGNGLIFITNGTGGTIQPIYAMRQGAEGDITLGDDETTNNFIVWSARHGGPYLTTPVLYENVLYIVANPGVLSAYNTATGERYYQRRLPGGGGVEYTASIVAADGKLYLANADGDTVVVRAGQQFEQLASNPLGDPILATPAISGDLMIIRTQHYVFGIGAQTAAR